MFSLYLYDSMGQFVSRIRNVPEEKWVDRALELRSMNLTVKVVDQDTDETIQVFGHRLAKETA
jgi:hypothetical protein